MASTSHLEHVGHGQHAGTQVQEDARSGGVRARREGIVAVGDQNLCAVAGAAERVQDFGVQEPGL
jgi:hypothetical protein